jgi:hypothetical protein
MLSGPCLFSDSNIIIKGYINTSLPGSIQKAWQKDERLSSGLVRALRNEKRKQILISFFKWASSNKCEMSQHRNLITSVIFGLLICYISIWIGNQGDDGEYIRPIVSHEYRLVCKL